MASLSGKTTRTGTRTATSTSSGTTSATPSHSKSSTPTLSLGLVLVTEELGSPAVIFDMSLSPATRQSIEDSGSKLRAALSTIFVNPAQQVSGRTALNDQVFVTALREVRWGSFILYNATHPMNIEGNSLIDVEALMTEMGASTLTTATRNRVLRTVAASAIQQQQQQQHQSHRRQLFGTLELITNNVTLPIDSTSTAVIVTFNIIMRNSIDAGVLMTALKNFAAQQTTTSASASGGNSQRVLADTSTDVFAGAIVSPLGSVNTTTLVSIDHASVRSIILVYSKSYWGIFLDWLLRNAYNVITFCGCLSIIFLILFVVRIFLAKRTVRLAAKDAAFRAERHAIHAAIVKARGDKIRKERWVYIRKQFIRLLLPTHAFILAGRRWKASGGARVRVRAVVSGSPLLQQRVLPNHILNNSESLDRRATKPISSPPSMPIKQKAMALPSPLPVSTLVSPISIPVDANNAPLPSFPLSRSRSRLQAAALRIETVTVSESNHNNNDIPIKKPELRVHLHGLISRMREIETKAQSAV